jgi:CRP-like cAMP-binding protein
VTSYAIELLLRRLSAVTRLSRDEERVVKTLPVSLRNYAAGTDFVRQGDKPESCALIVQGWACRYKSVRDGKRQILSLHFPGEVPDLQSLLLHTMDHSLAAINDLQVAHIPHGALNAAIADHPGLARPLWRSTLIDGAIYREWLLTMGRLNATKQMGHLFCELQARLEAVELASPEGGYEMPITQNEFADALGVSVVHVNRTLQELRRLGLIRWENGRVVIQNREELAIFAEFDPVYLHQLR